MSHHLVCSWLGLSSSNWPPDHYTLLGLKAGESDQHQIEERVHERLMRLRQYQLNHPEEVTEAMNRLARAFSCLTDPTAKKAYDAWLSGPRVMEPAKRTASDNCADPLAWLFGPWSGLANARSNDNSNRHRLADWKDAPPPPRRPTTADPTPLPEPARFAANGAASPVVPPRDQMAAPPASGPIDSFLQAAQCSRARRALTTRRALYHRMRATHRLIRAWEQAGKYVNRPTRRLVRPRERAELARQLRLVGRLLESFPPLLGRLGQPGFWVVSLARHEMVVPIFRMLVPSQRETLRAIGATAWPS